MSLSCHTAISNGPGFASCEHNPSNLQQGWHLLKPLRLSLILSWPQLHLVSSGPTSGHDESVGLEMD